jgi:putative tryptophan/tyrosine transport system substrate-binding protein
LFWAVSLSAEAQQTKIPHIGFLTSFGLRSDHQIQSFQEGLRALGYEEEKNIVIEYRKPLGKPDEASELAAQLVHRKVDVLVATDPTAIRAAKQATKTIPIVMLTNQDPVTAGLVENLARPGGNVTGVARLNRELSGKRLEILRDAVPKISHIGVLWVRPTDLGQGTGYQNYASAAEALRMQVHSLQVNRPRPYLEGAFQTAIKARINAIAMVGHNVLRPYSVEFADLAMKNRLPSVCEATEYVDAGCLMSYASADSESFRRAAVMVDKILKGAKPADLPVEQPTKFELVVNLQTAKRIGVRIPPNVLARADKVIK